jgi:hypothetical protein
MAYWNPNNLDRHYQKHPAGRDEDCWKDLMNKSSRITKSEYESESLDVIAKSWITYRAQELDVQSWHNARINPEPPYYPNGIYYADRRSIRTITNSHNEEIRTCFHEHFGGKHELVSARPSANEVESMLKYLNRLIKHQKSRQLKNLKILKVAADLPEPILSLIEELKA